MKTKLISKILLSLGLALVLGSAINQVHGGSQVSSTYSTSPEKVEWPTVTIYSTGDVIRGNIGSFVLKMDPPFMSGVTGAYVKFSVSGTAIPGVDYVALVSPAYVGASGYGVISVKTLPDPRGFGQAYSLVVTLEPGLGYLVGEPSSAKMMINPYVLPCCQ